MVGVQGTIRGVPQRSQQTNHSRHPIIRGHTPVSQATQRNTQYPPSICLSPTRMIYFLVYGEVA